MSRGAGGEDRPQVAIRGKIGDGPGNAVDVGRHKQSGFVGEHRIGHAADRGGDAGQAAGRGLEIDQAKSFDPAGCIRQAGQAKEIGRAVDVADLLRFGSAPSKRMSQSAASARRRNVST